MFNRLRYDTCATKSELMDNVSIFSHTLDVNRFVHNAPCMHDGGFTSGNTTSTVGAQPTTNDVSSAWGKMVELENDLRGQTRPASRCPAFDYSPKKGLISNAPLYGPKVPDIKLDSFSHLPSCERR